MKKLTGWIAASVFACFTTASNAADLANNLSETSQTSANVTDFAWQGQAFTTTATDYIIDQVTVAIHKSAVSATGTLNFYLWDATGAGGLPGAKVQASPVGSVDVSTLGNSLEDTYSFLNLNFALSPGTTYYVVLGGATIADGTVRWDYTTSTSGIGFPSFYSGSSDGGSTWNNLSTSDPQQMRVVAVPEPSTYALGAIGTLVLGWHGRRKSRKPA